MSTATLDVSARPRFRGVSHEIAFLAAVPAAIALAIWAPSTRAATAVAIYGATLATMFGTSALYHRIRWTSVVARRWMRRADHSAIVLLIAGTCTPFCLVLPEAQLATLALVWGAAAVGVLRAMFWVTAPKWLVALVYLSLGWLLSPWLPDIGRIVGASPLVFVLAGGLLYSFGAFVYAKKWPNPWPRYFGYHEVFHALTIAASILHFVAVVQVAKGL